MRQPTITVLLVTAIALVCIAWGVQSPKIIEQLPMSRMARVRVTATTTAYADPEFRGFMGHFAIVDIPPLPTGMAITEVVKSTDTMCDSMYLEVNGQFVGVIHTNNIFILGNTSMGRHDSYNFVVHSPIFVPPGSNLRMYVPWPVGMGLYPSFYIVGYALNIGEF